MTWQNEPISYSFANDEVTIECSGGTDFWRTTHYGFVHDSGHFYFEVVEGKFIATVRIGGQFLNQYDQAGLMIWQDERNWLKAGIEYVDERPLLSVVVTHEFSDWSVYPCDSTEGVTIRIVREGDTATVELVQADASTRMLRLAYMNPSVPTRIGLMACAPTASGFVAVLSEWRLQTG